MTSIYTPAALAGPPDAGVSVVRDAFGSVDGRSVERFTLSNAAGLTVQVVSLGANITAIRAPDRAGRLDDVVMGFDGPEGYLEPNENYPHIGATMGRVANRIAGARFTLDGKEYKTSANAGNHTLHGGFRGWEKALWDASPRADGVAFSLLSLDGDEGFPGTVMVQVTYRLTADSRLLTYIQAVSTKATPVNVGNHSYFNLGGHGSGPEEVYRTRITFNADRYTVPDADFIPTGEFGSVEGTPLDLRSPRLLGEVMPWFNYNHNFVVNRDSVRPGELALAARAEHEPSGRVLEVYSDQPGVQFYTSSSLPDPSKSPMIGKGGAKYVKFGAFCIEPQNFPDAIHHQGRFPDSVLRPGLLYKHNMVYKFSLRAC